MSAEYKLEVDAGATFTLSLRPCVETNGVRTPWDITGYTFTLAAICEDTVGYSAAHLYALTVADGWVQVELTPDETAALGACGLHRFEIDATLPSGDIRRLLTGNLYATGGTHV